MGFFNFGKSSSLYHPGSYSVAFLQDKVANYRKILNKLGIRVQFSEEMCCGGILINSGYEGDARKLARKNLDTAQKEEIKKIITNDPLCYKTLFKDYGEMLPDWTLEVEFILSTILNKIAPQDIKEIAQEAVIYIDPCYLGRYSNIYEEPRKLLALLGYKVIEAKNNREKAMCDGSCGGLKQTNPELANKIAKNLFKHLEILGTKKIVTPDPQSYIHLKENAPEGFEVLEFSEIICKSLGLKSK